jgi:beta-carotene ketolase (CrtO type)
MANRYDAIVIGAGHNGLTCACYLAKAGLKVLVLEQYSSPGGMTISEEIAGRGFLSDIHASGYLVAKLTPAPEELGLTEHGLELITPDPNWAQVFPNGRCLSIGRNLEATTANMAQFSRQDGQTWRKLYQRYLKAKPVIVTNMNTPPPSLAEEFERPQAVNSYHFQFQTARSWVNETFASPEVRNFFASCALHAALSPDDALGAEFAWLFASSVQDVGVSIVRGGMRKVSLALAAVLRVNAGEIRTNAKVTEIVIESSRAKAVRLQDGETIAVDYIVASNTDPRHLVLDLMGEKQVGPAIAEKIRRYEWGDSFFVIYAALDRPVRYRAGQDADEAGYVHAAGDSIDDLSQMFTECRAGFLPVMPMVGIINEAVIDPSRAPSGQALMKFVLHFVPYRVLGDATGRIRGTDWDEIKEDYADYIVDQLSDQLPGLRDRIIARAVQSPIDLERRIPSAVHGTHQHGAFLPYQIGAMRPIPELGRYRSPIPNVYLCGAGSHPGSGVTMAAGRNAAQVICSDLKLGFPSDRI